MAGERDEDTGPSQSAEALSRLLAQLARLPPGRPLAIPWVLRAGEVVAERFELVREIGRDGYGAVWEARDRVLGRSVAFRAVPRLSAGARAGFDVHREAEAVAQLAHPNVVQVFDVGFCDDRPYVVLELLKGERLQQRLERGPLRTEEALAIALGVARALAHAHRAGVLHRDLRPSSVFLTRAEGVKVLDFGLARLLGRSCVAGGTPGFTSPEQRRGAPEDERTDVFTFGALLGAMLDRTAAPPAGLVGLAESMQANDPEERPRDGGAVLALLVAFDRFSFSPAP